HRSVRTGDAAGPWEHDRTRPAAVDRELAAVLHAVAAARGRAGGVAHAARAIGRDRALAAVAARLTRAAAIDVGLLAVQQTVGTCLGIVGAARDAGGDDHEPGEPPHHPRKRYRVSPRVDPKVPKTAFRLNCAPIRATPRPGARR